MFVKRIRDPKFQLCLILGIWNFELWPAWFSLYFLQTSSWQSMAITLQDDLFGRIMVMWRDRCHKKNNRCLETVYSLKDVGSIIAQGVCLIIWLNKLNHFGWMSQVQLCAIHPFETDRIHVARCWVKLCHRDGWISVVWFPSSYLLGCIKIKDFKQSLVFSCKSAIVTYIYIYIYLYICRNYPFLGYYWFCNLETDLIFSTPTWKRRRQKWFFFRVVEVPPRSSASLLRHPCRPNDKVELSAWLGDP